MIWNDYLWIKLIHIISSVVLVGTGFGSAFYLFFIHRTGSTVAIAKVVRLVVRADFWFTTPAAIIQPVSGFYMVYLAGFSLNSLWLRWALGLYILAGLCWLPVVWLQIKMANMAQHTLDQSIKNKQEANPKLPDIYWKYARYWEYLGYPAFAAMLIIFALMVFKPN